MDAVTATTEMTAAEFLALPEDPNGRRFQLIDGELVVNEPTPRHSDAQGCVYAALRAWSRETAGRGWVGLPVTVRLDERNVCGPDVVWYREGRRPQRDGSGPHALPDLVVEVRSPSTWRYDIGAKKTNYELFGAGELWLIDTAGDVVFVFRRSRSEAPRFDVSLDFSPGETLTSPLLPGFELPVAGIFEPG